MSHLSQIEAALFFPALNTEVLAAATAEALSYIDTTVGETGQDLREHMQEYFSTNPYDGWGEATAVCLQQVVIDAFIASNVASTIDEAIIADMRSYSDAIASGAVIENPYDTPGDALNLRIWVIAVSHGGSPTEVWDQNDIPVTLTGYMTDMTMDVGGL